MPRATFHPRPLPPPAPPPRRLPVLLRRAWFGLNQAFRRRIADAGMTPGQFTALRTLIERGELTQRELTDIMSSDPNTITSLLSRMEKLGWVRRRTHERDRRANTLRLTAAGRRKFERVRPVAVDLQTRVLEALPGSEREAFLAALDKIADACQRELASVSE